MYSFSDKRIQYEEQLLIDNADQLPPNIQYKKIDNYHYLLQIIGQREHQDAYIIADINLNGFPVKAPDVKILNDFQHVNVYPLGNLCLYLTNKETWVSTTSLIEIFTAINQVIHYPTFNDPANSAYRDRQIYKQEMMIQAQKFRDEKYKII